MEGYIYPCPSPVCRDTINSLWAENERLKHLWFSDADPFETEYAGEYAVETMGEP